MKTLYVTLLLLLLVSGIQAKKSRKPQGEYGGGHSSKEELDGGGSRGGKCTGDSSEEKEEDNHDSTTVPSQTNITVLVANSVTNPPNQTFSTYVFYRGILLGGLRRLQESSSGFNFTYTEDPNYGPFLQSVNGLPGSIENRTYWELLVRKPNNTILRPNVGIGCYIPNSNDKIILKYTTY